MESLKNTFKINDLIIIVSIFSLLISEVCASPIRYILSNIGLSPLIYLPKIFIFLLVLYKIITTNFSRSGLIYGILFCVSCMTGLFYGAKVTNFLFSMLMYAPLFIGYFYGKQIDSYKKWFSYLLWFLVISSLIGIYMDYSFSLPWKGMEYEIGGQSIEGNREWDAGGIDRLAGFGRSSATTAVILSCLSLFIIGETKNKVLATFLFFLTFVGIAFTTTKSVVLAYLLAGLYSAFVYSAFLKRIVHTIIVIVGLALPTMSIFFEYNISDKITDPDEVILMASFDDRLLNTWPSVFNIIKKENAFLTGTGFGTVGTSSSLFPIDKIGTRLAVTDSTSLYLYTMFGIVGIYLFYRQIHLLNSFSKKEKDNETKKINETLQTVLVCIIIIGLGIDICESVTAIFFIGYALYKSKMLLNNK